MDFIVTLEKNLFKTETLEDSLDQLKENLIQKNQIDYYDFVYKRYNNDNENEICEGLSRVLKLFAVAIARVDSLYPKYGMKYHIYLDEIVNILLYQDIVEDKLTIVI